MGQVKDTVQFHVDDGDVQVAEGIWGRGNGQDVKVKMMLHAAWESSEV